MQFSFALFNLTACKRKLKNGCQENGGQGDTVKPKDLWRRAYAPPTTWNCAVESVGFATSTLRVGSSLSLTSTRTVIL